MPSPAAPAGHRAAGPRSAGPRSAGPRPTLRTALPFVAVLALGALVAAAPPYDLRRAQVWELAVVLLMLPVLAWVLHEVLRRDRHSWLDPALPCLTFVAVVLLRDLGGGSGSGLGPLVAIPIAWLVLFGTRADLLVGAVVGVLAVTAPLWLVAAPAYPPGEWRHAALWMGMAAVLVPAARQVLRGRTTEPPAGGPAPGGGSAPRTADRIVAAASLAALVTTDADGVVTAAGAGAAAVCGHATEEMVGRPFLELVHDPQALATAAEELGVRPGFAVLAALARRRAPARRWLCARADGEQVVVRLAVSELRDDAGGLTGYLVVAVDETENERTQRELTAAEARWRVLMDHLPDTIMVLVEQGTGIRVVTGAGLLAHRARDSAGRWLQELAAAGGVPLGEMLEAAFAGEERGMPVDASVGGRDHEVVVCPLPSGTGRAQALLMVRDVTRDRRRERAVAAAKQRADRLFEDAPQAVALVSLDGEVVRANPAMAALFGREDLVGRPLAALSAEPDDPTVPAHLAELRSGSAGHPPVQWSVRGADGTEAHLLLSSSLLAGEDDDPDLVLANLLDVSERHRYEQQLAHLADHDPLTGLANRRRFDAELDRHVAEFRRYGVGGAVLLLDLDHFKAVNDTLGHAAGDDLLVTVARALRARLRETDVVARVGGDEFAVLLRHTDRKAAERVAQDVVEVVREQLAGLDGARRQVTVSVGGALLGDPEHTSGDLLKAADAAMYAAKSAGRNGYVVHG